MRKIAIGFLVVFALATTVSVSATDTKVGGRIYAHWMMNMSDGADSFNEFALERAYVDIKSKLSDYTSARITTDLRSADVDGSEVYNIIIKYAYLDWKPAFANGVMTFRLGMQPTQHIDVVSNLWGRRYLMKAISDEKKLLTSSDLGAGLLFDLGQEGKTGYLAANIWNGSAYSDVEELNKQKDFSAFILLTPLADNLDFEKSALMAQAYVGTRNKEIGTLELDDESVVQLEASDYERSLFSFAGYLAYRNTFDLGADINFYKEGQGRSTVDGAVLDDVKKSGLSFFGTLYLKDLVADNSPLRTLNLFGRMDMYDKNTDSDDDAETLLIGGIECVPVKGFRASVNLRSLSYQNEEVDSESYLFLNTEFKF